VAIRRGWLAKQPSPKKWPRSSTAMTASFPACETTESRTVPLSTYITLVAGSPWAKIVAPGSCSFRWTATPVQSTRSGGVSGIVRFGVLFGVLIGVALPALPDDSSARLGPCCQIDMHLEYRQSAGLPRVADVTAGSHVPDARLSRLRSRLRTLACTSGVACALLVLNETARVGCVRQTDGMSTDKHPGSLSTMQSGDVLVSHATALRERGERDGSCTWNCSSSPFART
jgi:hypothetical protein